ncbi:hypothetical protein AOLI_G00054630 [Acnodon oligacanthus]
MCRRVVLTSNGNASDPFHRLTQFQSTERSESLKMRHHKGLSQPVPETSPATPTITSSFGVRIKGPTERGSAVEMARFSGFLQIFVTEETFLCLKNIRTFLSACCEVFGMKKSELFEAFDLFDVRDFGKSGCAVESEAHPHPAAPPALSAVALIKDQCRAAGRRDVPLKWGGDSPFIAHESTGEHVTSDSRLRTHQRSRSSDY